MAGSVKVVLKSVFDDKGIKQAQSEFANIGKGVGKSFAAIGAAAAVAGAATIAFAGKSISAAEGVAVANNRLAQVNESMGLFGAQTQAVTDRLIKFAEANELNVAVDAEVIKATQAKLLTFKNLASTADIVGGAMDRATMAALDLAATGFGTAESNAVQLGKALQDPIKGITALARAGVTFTETEKEKIRTLVESGKTLEAQELILAAIETQVGGTAQATAKASDKMKLAFENVLEATGAALLPAFEDLAVVVTNDLAPALAEVAEDVAPFLVDVIKLIAEVLKDATDPSTNLGASVAKLGDSFELLLSVLAGGESQIEGTTDTLSVFADALDFVIVTLAGFIAFIQSIGPAIEALQKGDFDTFWKWLNSDPITFMEGVNSAKNGIAGLRDEMLKFNNMKFTGSGGTLEFLQGMGMGGAKAPTTTTTTPTFTGGGSSGPSRSERIAETLKESQKAINAAQKDYRATVKKAQGTYASAVKSINEAYAKAVKQAEETRSKALTEAAAENTKAISRINADTAQKLADIVAASINRLRDAFRGAVQINVADLFASEGVGKSVDNLVKSLRERLQASQQLIANSAKLAAAGFSQTFIEQVVSSGVEAGNELATSILTATPETQKELMSLFGELETTSETGMDKLSQAIYDGTGLATTELKKLYADTLTEQTTALAEQATAYTAQQVEIMAAFDVALQEAATTRDTALADAMKAYQDALKKAMDEFLAELDEVEKKFKEKLKDLKAQKSDIDKLQKQIDAAKNVVPIPQKLTPNLTNQNNNNTTINVNVSTDSTKSDAQVGEDIVKVINKYTSRGGALVTGRAAL